MSTQTTAAHDHDGAGQRTWVYVAMAAGLAFVALSSLIESAQSREVGAPAATSSTGVVVSAPAPAPLDIGVDWSKVPAADNPAPMAVAAYDR